MKLFVDTNIFLDVWFAREGLEEAKMVLDQVSTGLHEGVVADITLLNIDYVAKNHQLVRLFLKKITDHFQVVGADGNLFYDALEMKNPDLEDNVQALLAKKTHCDVIVTSDTEFPDIGIRTLNAKQLLLEREMK